MVISTALFNFKKLKNLADWKLLLFLLLFLNVKLAVKIPAIVIIYLLQFNFKFGFSLKNSRLPLFYLLAIGIAVVNWLICRNYGNTNYNIVLMTGIGFWLLCILALHQVKLSVENNDTETIHRTIIIFFVLNAIFSILNLAAIIYETGYLNPYTYQGQYQKYFISTGDFIKGLTFDTSTTNAVLNAFGVIYFLTKRNTAMLFVCMGVMLLTGSNFTNMILLGILLVLFIFKTSRDQKSLVLVCLMFLVVFMVKVSPQNNGYVHETFKRTFHIGENSETPKPSFNLPITLMPVSLLSPEQIKQKIAHRYIDSMYVVTHPKIPEPVKITPPSKAAVPVQSTPVASPEPLKAIIANESGRVIVPVPNIHTKPYQHVRDTTSYQWRLLSFIGSHKAELPISAKNIKWYPINGKVLGFIQTTNFLRQHPGKILTGAGTGNFSSKLAFRTSGLGFAGGYPQKLTYLSPDFLKNHLDVYLNFFSKQSEFHTLSNNPGSVYDQLLAEYGLLGFAAFVICYLGFFLRHYKKMSYGLPILMVVLAVFLIDYWFEQLSILLFFELLLLLNIKESSAPKMLSHAN